MQHDQSKITGLRKGTATRVRNFARPPDKLDVRNGINPNCTLGTFSPKRKPNASRLSMMPPSLSTSSGNLRKLELEDHNLELELLYSHSVASLAELILEKKIQKDTELSLSNSIKSIYEETHTLQEKSKLIETRINDIKALSSITDDAELVEKHIKDFNDMVKKNDIQTILSHLKTLLDQLNVLPCENITLPTTMEELQQFKKTLTECHTILQQISNPTECDSFENFTKNYEEFVTSYNEISSLKQIVEEKIINLQSEVLQKCSHTLTESDM